MPDDASRATRRTLLRSGVACSLALAGCVANSDTDSSPGQRSDAPNGDAVRWTADVGGSIRHRPVVRHDVVHVAGGTNDRSSPPGPSFEPRHGENVVALVASEGSERWRYETAAGVVSRLVVRGGVYAVVGWTGPTSSGRAQRLVRIDDGSLTWATDPVDEYRSFLALGPRAAYLGTVDDAAGVQGEQLFAVRRPDGTDRWSVETGDVGDATVHGRVLYTVEGGDRRTSAYRTSDGSERWHREATPAGDLRVYDGTLFLEGAQDDAGNHPLLAVDAADGSERWRFSAPVDGPFVPTGAVASSGFVYATEYDGHLFGLDASDGTELWQYDVERGSTTDPPVVAGETLYLASGSGSVHAVDAVTGERRWRRSPPGRPRIAAANGRGVVVRSSAEAKEGREHLRAYAPDGTERWAFATDRDLTRPAVSGSRAYVGTGDGIVVALGVSSP